MSATRMKRHAVQRFPREACKLGIRTEASRMARVIRGALRLTPRATVINSAVNMACVIHGAQET